MTILLCIVVAAGGGLLGMMGLGGGVLYVPVLSWAGLDFKSGAIPLSLLLGSATGMAASWTYLSHRLVHVRTAIPVLATALIGAPLGAAAGRVLPTAAIKVAFALAAGAVAVRILRSVEPRPEARRIRHPLPVTLGLGLVLGFSGSLLGIGGGFLMVPFLMATGFPTKEAAATSSLVVAFSALAGFVSHLPTARFPLSLAAWLILSALVGSRIGGLWASRHARPQTLRTLLGVVILVIASKVLFEGFAGLAAPR